MRLSVMLAVALLATTASLAAAQITSATISGSIKDQTGGVLPGADVVVKNLDTGLTRSVVTESNGYSPPPGRCCGRSTRRDRFNSGSRFCSEKLLYAATRRAPRVRALTRSVARERQI